MSGLILLATLYGLFWLLAYLEIIRKGLRDRTYGMPLLALAANLSWEFLFSFVIKSPKPQVYINYLWFGFDFILLLQILKFGPGEFPRMKRMYFYSGVFALIAAFYVAQQQIVANTSGWSSIAKGFEGEYIYGAVLTAFFGNLVMSALFLWMLFVRQDTRGQSISIAVFKMLGTLCASLHRLLFLFPSAFLTGVSIAILLLDLLYLVLLQRKVAVLVRTRS